MTDFFPGFDVEDERGECSIPTPGADFDSNDPTGGTDNFPVSNRKIPTPDFKSEVVKGSGVSLPLASPHGCGNAISPFQTKQSAPLFTIHGEKPPEQLALREEARGTGISVSTNTFARRVRWFTRSLSPARRAEIGRRARFRNQPYLRRADEPDDDFLP